MTLPIRRRILIGVCILVVLVAVAGLLSWEALALRRNLLEAQSHLDQAVDIAEPAVRDGDSVEEIDRALAEATAHLTQAEASLEAADGHAGRLGPVLAVGGRLPGWFGGLDEIDPMVTAAREMTRAGLILSDASRSMLTTVEQEPTGDEPVSVRLIAGLTESEAEFAEARTAIERALAARRQVDAGDLRGPLRVGATALARFDERAGQLEAHAALLTDLPSAVRAIMGMNGARTYALLGQNSAELRPTGGFIGSMGLITVEGGAITADDYRSSYEFDNPARGFWPAPAPIAYYLGGGRTPFEAGWAVRDANWSADFPTSAGTVAGMLAYHQDIKVDGVIGVTTFAVGALLDALGSVTVEGFEGPVSAATWYQAAQELIYFPGDSQQVVSEAQQNKEVVLEPIMREVIRRVQHASGGELPAIVRALRSGVQERELLLWFRDPAPSALMERYEADGRVRRPPAGDVLALVDANLSYSKVGPYIQTTLTYEVWLNERGVATESRATVTYENRMTQAMAEDPRNRIGGLDWDAASGRFQVNPGVYGTYARLYIPENSRLIAASPEGPEPETSEERSLLVLGRYESVPATELRSYSYTYQIPTDVADAGEYRLRVIKQPGTSPQLEIRIHVPSGVIPQVNRPLTQSGTVLTYHGTLTETLDLQLSLIGVPE